MIPVKIQTLIVSVGNNPSVLVLEPYESSEPLSTRRIIPIWIGQHEAEQLRLALNDFRLPRPLSLDLLLDAITNLDAYVDHIVINHVRKSMFFAQLVLRQHGRLILLDSRPSDAIILAIKQNADMYIEEDVLDIASYPYIFRDKPFMNEDNIEAFHEFLKSITPDDFKEKGY